MAAQCQIGWHVLLDDGQWAPFSGEDAAMIESIFVSNPLAQCELPLGPTRMRYVVDFGAMTQLNTTTKRARAVRRSGPLPVDHRGPLPASFEQVKAALRPFHRWLGGTPHCGRRDPCIPRKLKKSELAQSSDYEYIFMTVLGFQALQAHGDEIVRLNNGGVWKSNPGTMRMEEVCGFTMHGDRDGANGVVRSAPDAILQAFSIARRKGTIMEFFKGEAFDRTADPCLEGRLGRVLAFIEANGGTDQSGDTPPWEDVSIAPMPAGMPPEKVVGEHLRVFVHCCIRDWGRSSGLTYAKAKDLWMRAGKVSAGARLMRTSSGSILPQIEVLCNESTFSAHLLRVGVVQGRPPADGSPPPACALPPAEVQRALRFYIEMGTLSPAP